MAPLMPQATYSFGDDRLAGGADLMAVLDPAGINHRRLAPSSPPRALARACDDRHVVFLADPAAGGDDDFRLGQIDVFLFGRFVADEFQMPLPAAVSCSTCGDAARLLGRERRRPGW